MKNILITYLSNKEFDEFLKTINDYDKVYIFYKNSNKIKKENKKLILIKVEKLSSINKEIDKIIEKEKNNNIIPMFFGEGKSRYNIYTINKIQKTKINYKIFRDKKVMNNFLSNTIDKNNLLLDKNIEKYSYKDLQKTISNKFVIKPINAASSVSSFKILNSKDFDNFKNKYQKKFNYIVEEYLEGDLKSIDFYFDGKDIFIFCVVKETCFNEYIEQNKLSKNFLEIYGDYINKYFLNHIPLRYGLDIKDLSKYEVDFLNKLKIKLTEIKYKGVIHLEYKFNKETNKVGFIEWGARRGAYREYFSNGLHNIIYEAEILKISLNDFSAFKKLNNIYIPKIRNKNSNVLSIKYLFPKNINAIKVINRREKKATQSFKEFVLEILKNKLNMEVYRSVFFLDYNDAGFFLNSHSQSHTRLSITFFLDDKNFKQFKLKESDLVELFIFSDYGKMKSLF